MAVKSVQGLLSQLKDDMAGVLRVFVPQKLMLNDGDFMDFLSWEKNWHQRPPAIIRKNGIMQVTGYEVDYTNGVVHFDEALEPTDVVTAEFFFTPFSDQQLVDYLERALDVIASLIGVGIDENGVLERYQAPIVDEAFVRVFSALMAETANYHKWVADGVEMHKEMMTENFALVVREKKAQVKQAVARLRLESVAGGTTAALPTVTEV